MGTQGQRGDMVGTGWVTHGDMVGDTWGYGDIGDALSDMWGQCGDTWGHGGDTGTAWGHIG